MRQMYKYILPFTPQMQSRASDSHSAASAWVKRDFADTDQSDLARIQARALELLHAHTKEMEEKYGEKR